MSYSESIAQVVTAHRTEIEHDLVQTRGRQSEAEAELQTLEQRIAALEGLLSMGGALAAGGPGVMSSSEQAPLTLHAAMAKVLSTAPNRMLRAGDIARQVEQRGLYKMRDGRAVEATQIHARVGHYPHLFRKNGSFIELIATTAD